MQKLPTLVCLFAILASPTAAQPPLQEVEQSDIGYGTVEEARAALGARKDVKTYVERGWTIVADEKHYTIWSFSPSDHPTHPTAVKRQIVPVGDASRIVMSVKCGGPKKACDDLVREFAAMNGIPLKE